MPQDDRGWLSRRWRLFVAARYLKARRKQAFTSVVTVVSILGVVVGVAALIIALALLTGFQQDIQDKIIGANAHVFVQSFGSGPIEQWQEVAETARSVDGVVAAAPALLVTGLVDSGIEQPAFVNLKGVDPRLEARATELLDRIVEGSAEGLVEPPGGDPGIVLGTDLAAALFVGTGDTVTVTVFAPDMLTPFGSGLGIRIEDFEVVGIFEAGMYEYDNTWALVDLGTAQRLKDYDNAVSMVQVRVSDIYATGPIVEELRAALDEAYFVMDWQRMNRAYFAALRLEKLALFVTISLIVMVAALNIVATLVLMIKDKQRDIGILMSLGATRRDILQIFVAQGLTIGLFGTALGCALGVGASWLMNHYRIIRLEASVYYLSYVPFDVEPWDFGRVALFAVLISFAATLYPAWRASRLDPVESMRYE